MNKWRIFSITGTGIIEHVCCHHRCLVTKLYPTLWILSCIPWTAACQAPLSTEFSRQEYWSGLPFPLQGTFLTQESNLHLLHRRCILYHWASVEAHSWTYIMPPPKKKRKKELLPYILHLIQKLTNKCNAKNHKTFMGKQRRNFFPNHEWRK